MGSHLTNPSGLETESTLAFATDGTTDKLVIVFMEKRYSRLTNSYRIRHFSTRPSWCGSLGTDKSTITPPSGQEQTGATSAAMRPKLSIEAWEKRKNKSTKQVA